MTKRVFLLMGVATLAVVLSHAASWGQIALFDWADRYRAVTVPNYDALGSVTDYVLVIIRQLATFAVPGFLFCSGFFVAYAARGSRAAFGWKMVRTRLIDLLIPYLLWTGLSFGLDALQGNTLTSGEYIARFITGDPLHSGYYFVILVTQFYLLSPWIILLAQRHPRRLLIITAAIQFCSIGVKYLILIFPNNPGLPAITWLSTQWLGFAWIFFFAAGVSAGFHTERFRLYLSRWRRVLPIALLILAVLGVVEPEVIYRVTGIEWRNVPLTFASNLYALIGVLTFLSDERILSRFSTRLYRLGSKSYGIYLVHQKTLEFGARAIRQIAPWILAQPVLLLTPILFALGLGVSWLLMQLVARSPARIYYRYLFG
jgi:membrane-bound acyltransferase YfiQ involved in biofilm formation